MNELLRNAIILDTETLGLERGAGMHELAFMDLETRFLRSFVLDPNAVTVQTMPQELTRLAGTEGDRFTQHRFGSWMEALHWQVERQAGQAIPQGQTMSMLKEQQPWLHSMIKHYPHLLGTAQEQVDQLNNARTRALDKFGVKADLGRQVAPEDALGTLKQAMSGKTVWIANTVFESKQVGAQLGAAGQAVVEEFKRGLETWNPDSPDPFYVTGAEVTRERVRAQADGDWTRVYRAYLKHQPQAGETAVRDIQDVTRALHSYGYKLGFTDRDMAYLGTGVDISHRLHALAAQDHERVNLREFHRAAEDVAIHEQYVLERNLRLTETARNIAEGTDLGKQYLQAGEAGPAGELARYFQALRAHAPILQEEQVLKRLQRAQQDLLQQGFTSQRQGGRPFMQKQLTPGGELVSTWRTMSTRSTYHDMESVLQHVQAENRYDLVDVRNIWQGMAEHAGTEPELAQHVLDRLGKLRNQYQHVQVPGVRGALDALGTRQRSTMAHEILGAGVKAASGHRAVFAGGAALLAFMGAGATLLDRQERPAPASMLHYSYDQWAERQRLEGLSTGEIAQAQRHKMTDFGSPYRGPVGVQQVFIDQEMLRERERWLRAQYGAVHYRSKIPGLPTWNPQGGYQYVQGSESVRGADYGMRGNLQRIDISNGNWKITAEDADTVTIRRGGLVGSVQSFFGLNRGYSFRLAGLDSTEIAHADRPAQPFANQAARAFQSMLARSQSIEVIFDPNEITYGRALGAVYADGRNLNYELVKRGLASHLPFGKAEYAIINYQALEEAERRAYQTNRGMWSQPWARAFYEHSEASGNRPTFNSLANPQKVVQNHGTMMMLGAMEAAQAQGAFTPGHAALAGQLGSSYNVGDDAVGPRIMTAATTPSTSYLQEQLQDLAGFIRTKGRNNQANKLSHRGGYGALDATLALDMAGTTNRVESRRRNAAFSQYRSGRALDQARKARMAAAQRQTLQNLNSRPVGHHRM